MANLKPLDLQAEKIAQEVLKDKLTSQADRDEVEAAARTLLRAAKHAPALLLMLGLGLALTACVSGTYEKAQDGTVRAEYGSLFKDVNAPSVLVQDGDKVIAIKADASVSTLSPQELQAIGKAVMQGLVVPAAPAGQ